VEKPLSFIETKGKILMTGDKQYINFLVSCLQLEKQKDKIINIENLQGFGELTDPGYGKNLLAHLGDNVDTKVPMVDTETYEKLMSAIKIGEITVVIESPPEWALTHEIAVNYNFNHAFVLASNAFTRGVGRHNQIIYFSDYNEALAFANKTATYYIKNYYSICENSLYDGQIVAYAYALGNTSFRLRCPNQNDTTQKIRLY